MWAVLLSLALAGPAQAADYYVATNGNDSTGTGSIGSPYATLTKAVSVVSAGDTIYMRGGTYNPTAKISLSAIGTAANPYRIRAYSGEHPSINCSAVGSGTDGFGLTGAYWQLYGLEIYGAPHNAIRVQGGSTAGAGSHNTIEFCSFHDCGNTGFSIGASQTPTTYLAGSNLVLNCDAYRNFDPPDGGNADGFSVKYYVGPGNTFRGCRSWENSDDGWDLFGATSPVLIDTCWTWRNGSNVWGAAYNSTFNGNGNGFKLGGNYVATAHRLVRGVAYQNVGNGGKGIDQNNNLGSLTIDNSTSWGNRAADINMDTTPTTSGVITLRNNLVISGTTDIQNSATQISNSWLVITSPDAGTNDVLSLDASFLAAPRQTDGSLPITPLVRPVPNGRLVDKGANIGEPFYGSAPDLGAYETVVLTWRGDGVSNVWNSGVTSNWFDGQRLMVFTNTAYITFDDTGSNSPSINLVGTLSPFSVAVASTKNYTFGGTGSLDGWMMSLVKSGTGQLTVTTSNTFGGGTTVSNGTLLLVNNTAGSGTGTGAVTVVSGATLGGSGTIGGPVTVNGTLAPGNGIGTLTISNTLAVNSGAVLQYALGTSSDLTTVSSNLTLGGTLNITDAGGFTNTTYRLFNYGGTLTYNGLTVGTKPNMNFIYTVSTSTIGQVNLIVSNATVSPVASFTAAPTNGAAPLVVNFTDNSTGSITSSAWNFGDGGTTNFTTPTSLTYTYGSPGTYTVTLIATGPGGSSTNTQAGLITALAPFTAWQLQYFGCTNNGSLCAQAAPDADPYGKGISNTNQFLLGLNPTNPASVFQILSVVPQSNDMVITWATGAGPSNVVQATGGDVSGNYATNFLDISGPLAIPGSGNATNSFWDTGGATNSPSRYYRIRLGP